MKNATRSNRLTLVDNNGREISLSRDIDDVSVAYVPSDDDLSVAGDGKTHRGLSQRAIVMISVSAACFAAAVATATYAIWLSRRTAAQEALTNVGDLLQSCQRRMSQMEQELSIRSITRPA